MVQVGALPHAHTNTLVFVELYFRHFGDGDEQKK